MYRKVILTAQLGIAFLILLSPVRLVQAGIEPVLAVNQIYAALNSGDLDMAMATFAEDATAENLVRKETYNGLDEIHQMLQGMQREGRRYDIVNIQMDGDTINAKVEVSDRGFVWGTMTIEAVVKDDKLQTLTMMGIRLELWRIGR